ncbi:MAG: Veg family protein [Culicoidibacterales bacterium]
MKNRLRKQMQKNQGEEIILICDEGRNIIRKERAIIREIYNSVFVLDVYKENIGMQRESYSYADLITKVVQLFNVAETQKVITV